MTNNRRLKLLLCGYGHLALSILKASLKCADVCEVVGVFRWASKLGETRFWEPVENILKNTVQAHGIPDLVCPGMNHYEFSTILERYQPDVVLVASWGEILKPHLLERSDTLFVNCHPSKLPAHRGANPYASVILADEKETGVTFHLMVPEIDAGPIILQETCELTEHETGDSLRQKCGDVAARMTPILLKKLAAHCIDGAPLETKVQDPSQQSYYPPLKPESGLIPWELDAKGVYRHCRAMFPWNVCYSYLEGRRMVRLFSPHFMPVPQPNPQPVPGGTILAYRRGILTIALSDPYWVMEVPAFQMVGREGGAWPLWLSRLVAPLWFKPGKRFGPKML